MFYNVLFVFLKKLKYWNDCVKNVCIDNGFNVVVWSKWYWIVIMKKIFKVKFEWVFLMILFWMVIKSINFVFVFLLIFYFVLY